MVVTPSCRAVDQVVDSLACPQLVRRLLFPITLHVANGVHATVLQQPVVKDGAHLEHVIDFVHWPVVSSHVVEGEAQHSKPSL